MNKNSELEEKYIEERVAILKRLSSIYGNDIYKIAAEEKKKLERKRIIEKYKEIIPVNMQSYYKIAFNDFEQIDELLGNSVLKMSEDKLIVQVDKCQYCEMYSKFDGNKIGKELVCNMDKVITETLNQDFSINRPKRKMDGDQICVFEIIKKDEKN